MTSRGRIRRFAWASLVLAILVVLPAWAHDLFSLQVGGKSWSCPQPQAGQLSERSGQGLHPVIWADRGSDSQVLVVYPAGAAPGKKIPLGGKCRARVRCSSLPLQGPQDLKAGAITINENDQFHFGLEIEGTLRDGRVCQCTLWMSKDGTP